MIENSSELQGVGRSPDFIVIGAMKSGTTSLCAYLDRHPGLFMCSPKEPQFFSRPHVFARGFDWYRSLFAGATADQLCGEASTCYSRWPRYSGVAEQIKKHLPEVKLIYLMRHPVERIYSHYRHLMEERHLVTGQPLLSLKEALVECDELVSASLYMQQIQQYLPHYPRERFLFLVTDDLGKDPGATLAVVERFLGVDPHDLVPTDAPLVTNRSGDKFARRSIKRGLAKWRANPAIARLLELLPRAWRHAAREQVNRSRAVSVLTRIKQRRYESRLSPLDSEVRNELLERLEQPTRELEQFLGRALPNWFE